jgi:hypothetical protein
MFRNLQLASASEECPQANVGKQYSLVTEHAVVLLNTNYCT